MQFPIFFTFISAALLILSGCATYQFEGTTTSANNPIKTFSSRKGEIKNVRVEKLDNRTLVSGSIRRNTASRILNGHVHIELRNEKNTILDKVTLDYALPRRGRHTAQAANFKAELATPLTENITIKVEHHDYDNFGEGTGKIKVM